MNSVLRSQGWIDCKKKVRTVRKKYFILLRKLNEL